MLQHGVSVWLHGVPRMRSKNCWAWWIEQFLGVSGTICEIIVCPWPAEMSGVIDVCFFCVPQETQETSDLLSFLMGSQVPCLIFTRYFKFAVPCRFRSPIVSEIFSQGIPGYTACSEREDAVQIAWYTMPSLNWCVVLFYVYCRLLQFVWMMLYFIYTALFALSTCRDIQWNCVS